MDRKKLIGELLSLLERKETTLLSWGFIDGAFSAEEVVDTFREAAPELVYALDEWIDETSVELFVDNLAQANILVRTDTGYRSRFAETVRLLGRLRQRFSNDDWASAPSLVSDLKFHLCARSYPKRNIHPDEAWQEIEGLCWLTPIQKIVFDTLTGTIGHPLNLAGFQLRATQRILSNYQPCGQATGTVISAGTGSGKTKAFYLPAFMGIAADVAVDRRSFTKVLAIYPRNVLLADQFTEAISQAKILYDANLPLPRSLTFAAYLGDTPHTTNLRKGQRTLDNWKRCEDPKGWIPPFIKHPEDGSDLIWLDKDRESGSSTLRSARKATEIIVPDGMIRLTRDKIRANPPDVLMMSLEMLNREMSDPASSILLGFNQSLPGPRLFLLDEIHTHEGMSGAQVPWILRRWSHWVQRLRDGGASTHFVGLSATLKEASVHLATLTGAHESHIVEISPEEAKGEVEKEGIEYNVAIKSHAGSGISVLATSIQTLMLGARALTPAAGVPWNGSLTDIQASEFFGKKVFGFTDNLDSLNRWYADFIDADRNRRLAQYRSASGLADVSNRNNAGQIWGLCEDLGHDLRHSLRITRTSSQDPGVTAGSDVIIATSSLEVGYDDPDVGMTVHHKSPRSAASFLQRKGRSGRRRGVRPWTLLVLSDFGRDRWAFRDSDRIFHPELDPLKVPSLNPYVMRVQATQFLIDWIGLKVRRGVPYRYLSEFDSNVNSEVGKLLLNVITDKGTRNEFLREFYSWIKNGSVGLRLSDPVALGTSVLWDSPRAILRHAVPELAKMSSASFTLPDGTQVKQKRPLPRFVPPATFGSLDAQDVDINIAGRAESEVVDIAVALREVVPCRVSRRYAVGARDRSLWLAASAQILQNAPASLPVVELFPQTVAIGVVSGIQVYQPLSLSLDRIPERVSDSSNGNWEWQYNVEFEGTRERLGLADGPVLSRVFSSCDGYFHRRYAHAVVTRYASTFRHETLLARGVKQRGIVQLAQSETEGGAKEGVGYRRSVDAITFKIPSVHLSAVPELDTEAQQRLRPYFFRFLLSQSPVLQFASSPFGIGALWTTSLAMLIATAITKKKHLQDADSLLRDRSAAAQKVFQCMLLEGGELDPDNGSEVGTNKRIDEIRELWGNPAVRDEVRRLEKVLWEKDPPGFSSWLVSIYIETLRQALEQAIYAVLLEIPEGDLAIDNTSCEEGHILVVTETASGGVGHLERLAIEIGNAPERFDAAFEAALKSCSNERIVSFLLSGVEKAKVVGSDINAAFEQVRISSSFHDLDAAKGALIHSLRSEGLLSDRVAITALVSKVLRPGSSPITDRWITYLNRKRARFVERVGLAIDQRVFAYLCMQSRGDSRRMREHLRHIGHIDPKEDQVYNAFIQLSFDRCTDSCHECLGIRKEMEGIVPSRWLAREWINLEGIDFHIDARQLVSWRSELELALSKAHRIRITCSDEQRMEVARELSSLLAQEHDRGYIFSPFTTLSVTQTVSDWEIVLQPSHLGS